MSSKINWPTCALLMRKAPKKINLPSLSDLLGIPHTSAYPVHFQVFQTIMDSSKDFGHMEGEIVACLPLRPKTSAGIQPPQLKTPVKEVHDILSR